MEKSAVLIICFASAFAVGFGTGLLYDSYISFPDHHASITSIDFQRRTTSISSIPSIALQNRPTSSIRPANNLRYAVNIAYKPGIGDYLINSSNFALYVYANDIANSAKSTCYGQCAAVWQAFYTTNLTVEPAINLLDPGVNISMFGAINRTDGTKQLTYNGYPLYYYKYDTGAGNINGQGNGSTGYLISPLGTVIHNAS